MDTSKGTYKWLGRLDVDEKGPIPHGLIVGKGGNQLTIISESGLYKLIMRSDKPEAKSFQDWVTKVVLPSIRKDGGYIMGEEKLATGEMNTQVITIDTIAIKQDSEGRYCLNDLHKAAGNITKHQPSNFLRLDSTRELSVEISHSSDVRTAPVEVVYGGRNPGTYVRKELVYAYAMWISASFHLKVIRAYDRLATQGVAVHENAAEDFLTNPLKYMEAIIGKTDEIINPPDILTRVES